MITRDIKVFGGKETESGGGHAASAATPDDIAAIGRPGIHLISGGTGVGKSVVARNLAEEYALSHARAKTNPPPDLLIYTGAGGDPVFMDLKGNKRVKLYTPAQETEFVDEINKRYHRAMTQKGGGGTPPESLVKAAKDSGAHLPGDVAATHLKAESKGGSVDEEAHRPVLIIVDDSGSSDLFPTMMLRSPIAQAVQSHRHADMSFIISSQRYHNLNTFLRANASSANVYPPSSREERNFLMRELPIPHKAMERGFAVAQSKGKHHFISVDIRNKIATHNFSGVQI